MRYMDTHCKCTQDYKNDTYTFSGKDRFTNKPVSVTVPGPALFRYRNGAMMQDAFPMLSRDEREFLMTGMYDSFPEEDEDEDDY